MQKGKHYSEPPNPLDMRDPLLPDLAYHPWPPNSSSKKLLALGSSDLNRGLPHFGCFVLLIPAVCTKRQLHRSILRQPVFKETHAIAWAQEQHLANHLRTPSLRCQGMQKMWQIRATALQSTTQGSHTLITLMALMPLSERRVSGAKDPRAPVLPCSCERCLRGPFEQLEQLVWNTCRKAE